MKYVGLADCNNFFVSCERIFRPDLWEKPVVVLSSNDGAVVARSNEVKELGVPMGVPYFKIKDIIVKNNVAVFSSNFDLYRDISSRVMNTLKNELDEVEQYSVDESFFRMEMESVNEARAELARLKALVYQNVGIPMSFGLAPSKTIAKYAAEKEKRGSGVSVITKQDWHECLEEVQLGDLWGVGGAMSQRFKSHNLNTAKDLLNADTGRLQKLFGVYGTRLLAEISGDVHQGKTLEDDLQKSIMSTRSFRKTTTDFSILEEALAYHVSQVAAQLRDLGAITQKISIYLLTNRHSEWVLRGGSNEALLPEGTNDTTILLKEAVILAKKIFEKDVPYKKVGVMVSSITPEKYAHTNLFGESLMKNSLLMQAIDKLNKKIGKETVTFGRTGSKHRWDSKHEYRSRRYTTKWGELPSVV